MYHIYDGEIRLAVDTHIMTSAVFHTVVRLLYESMNNIMAARINNSQYRSAFSAYGCIPLQRITKNAGKIVSLRMNMYLRLAKYTATAIPMLITYAAICDMMP